MNAFTTAIVQLFSMFTVLFGAGEKIAKTIDNLATVAEQSSGQYKDQSEANRVAAALKRAKQLESEAAAEQQAQEVVSKAKTTAKA